MMKSVFQKLVPGLTLALSLSSTLPALARAQDPQASSTPMDEKARQRAERDAKKAAEQEEKALRAAAEKERKEAEAEAREREKAAARLAVAEPKDQAAQVDRKEASADKAVPTPDAVTKEQLRIQQAEEKARSEAEKARKKEEDRARGQDAKDAERRRKDEERAGREAQRARETEGRARADALQKEQEGGDKPVRRAATGGESTAPESSSVSTPVRENPPAPLGKDDERRRRELVKQIEKARTERDRLNREAEDAERQAKAARAAAGEGQRSYEALTTGLDVGDVTPTASPIEEAPKKNRFLTKADEKQAAASKNAPQTVADPLRIALELKNPDAEARERAAFSLASLGPDAQPATRALMAALADANAAVRVAAAQALGRIGTGAIAAFAPLSAALTDPDPAVKNAAQAALLSIQGR